MTRRGRPPPGPPATPALAFAARLNICRTTSRHGANMARSTTGKPGYPPLPADHPLFKRGFVIGMTRSVDFSTSGTPPAAAPSASQGLSLEEEQNAVKEGEDSVGKARRAEKTRRLCTALLKNPRKPGTMMGQKDGFDPTCQIRAKHFCGF
jgi:hypothetical protein